jgi:hypothetical protein
LIEKRRRKIIDIRREREREREGEEEKKTSYHM